MSDKSAGDKPSNPAVQALVIQVQTAKKELDEYSDRHRVNLEEFDQEKTKVDGLTREMNALSQKLAETETEFSELSARLQATTQKLDETIRAADESERARRALDHRKNLDEERIAVLEQMLKETQDATIESDKKYDEVSRKLLVAEADLERVEGKTESANLKAKQIQEDMQAITSKLKALQSAEEKKLDREEVYEKLIDDLKARIKNAVSRANDSEDLVAKLQNEADHLKDELNQSRIQYQSLKQELDPYSGRK